MQKLEELIAALESAKGPSRELDFWLSVRVWEISEETDAALEAEADEIAIGGRCTAKPFTSSIDAAVALVGRVLPDANCWGIDKDERGIEAHVQRNGVATGHWAKFAEHATSPAIALVLVTVLALSTKEQP
jgi:hypothetical protein